MVWQALFKVYTRYIFGSRVRKSRMHSFITSFHVLLAMGRESVFYGVDVRSCSSTTVVSLQSQRGKIV